MTQKSKKEESFQKAEVNSDRYYRSPKEERSFWHMGIRDHKSSFSGTVRREAKLQSQSHEWVIKSNYSRSGAKKRKELSTQENRGGSTAQEWCLSYKFYTSTLWRSSNVNPSRKKKKKKKNGGFLLLFF